MRRRWLRALWIAPIAMMAMAAIFLLICLLLMSLWNSLLPDLFGWKPITFWQAAGLLILSRILFVGFRGRSGWRGHWRHRMQERWERMTPEEREKFRAGMRDRCGTGFRTAYRHRWMRERWEEMTPEERESFLAEVGARGGPGAPGTPAPPAGVPT